MSRPCSATWAPRFPGWQWPASPPPATSSSPSPPPEVQHHHHHHHHHHYDHHYDPPQEARCPSPTHCPGSRRGRGRSSWPPCPSWRPPGTRTGDWCMCNVYGVRLAIRKEVKRFWLLCIIIKFRVDYQLPDLYSKLQTPKASAAPPYLDAFSRTDAIFNVCLLSLNTFLKFLLIFILSINLFHISAEFQIWKSDALLWITFIIVMRLYSGVGTSHQHRAKQSFNYFKLCCFNEPLHISQCSEKALF